LHQLWNKGLFYYEEIQREMSLQNPDASETEITEAWQ
jgi:hypothetical protein